MSHRALIALVATLTLSAGCLGGWNGDTGMGDAGTGNMNGGGDGGTTQAVDVVADFNANVAPIIGGADGKSGACGGCHAKSGGVGPGFMAPNPDMLTTMLGYPGLVGKDPPSSRLYAKGVHEGPALTADQAPIVAAWIVEYNANKPMNADGGVANKPTIAPFAPNMGANTIDLSALDPSLVGMTITFDAKMIGSSLELSSITLKPTAAAGLHIAHPLWVTWDAEYNATPDPVDSFAGLDETVAAGSTAAMGPGELILPSFAMGQKLNVVFSTIEAKQVMGDGGTVAGTGCKALQNFVANVKPLLQQNCNNCHVGANPTAGLSFDFNRNSDEQVCENALTEVNKTNVPLSLLLQRPNPQVNDGHPQKLQNYGPYSTAVTNWINAEK